jgi:hypothetical protein
MKTISRTIPAAATTIDVPTNNIEFTLPLSVTLHSADATRAIELSTNDGLDYFTPQIDITTASMLMVLVEVPITNVKATGVAGNVLTLVY